MADVLEFSEAAAGGVGVTGEVAGAAGTSDAEEVSWLAAGAGVVVAALASSHRERLLPAAAVTVLDPVPAAAVVLDGLALGVLLGDGDSSPWSGKLADGELLGVVLGVDDGDGDVVGVLVHVGDGLAFCAAAGAVWR